MQSVSSVKISNGYWDEDISKSSWATNYYGTFALADGPGDGLGPAGAPPGEKVQTRKNGSNYVRPDKEVKGVEVLAPNGNYYPINSRPSKVTYSDGKIINGQQKKAGVWSYTIEMVIIYGIM